MSVLEKGIGKTVALLAFVFVVDPILRWALEADFAGFRLRQSSNPAPLLIQHQGQLAPAHPSGVSDDWRFTAAQFSPSASCSNIAEIDDFASPPLQASYPLPPVKCELAVVATGLPRSGSTLQMLLVQRILAAVVGTTRLKGGCYWDLHKHIDFQVKYPSSDPHDTNWVSQVSDHYAARAAMLEAVREQDILVVKTHEFKPQLLQACKKTVIVSTTRSLIDVLHSIQIADWKVKSLTAFLLASVQRLDCWREASLHENVDILEVDYNNLASDIEGFLHRFLALSDMRVDQKKLAKIAQKVRQTEANPQFPSSSTKLATNSSNSPADIAEEILRDPVLAAWQRRHGYSH